MLLLWCVLEGLGGGGGWYNITNKTSLRVILGVENYIFPTLLESVLVNIWGGSGNRLERRELERTRQAITSIRKIYRFKGESGSQQPSKINYGFKKNRAGYLESFGERHAYLSFLHLRNVQSKQPDVIPLQRGKKNELVITSLGAGACIELYGLCLIYLGESRQTLTLKLNSIEKEREWVPNRHLLFSTVLKRTFPRLEIDPVDIDADLRKDAIPQFSQHYDRLSGTDILLIYNVLNEIPTTYSKQVWRNVKFLLDNFQKPVLILLMEPSAGRAEPRILWLKQLITQESELVESSKEELFYFDTPPACIEMDSSKQCLNYRLFGMKIEGSKPTFERHIQRSHMACIKRPNSPLSMEQVSKQLLSLETKRGRRGVFLPRHGQVRQQYTFGHINEQWR